MWKRCLLSLSQKLWYLSELRHTSREPARSCGGHTSFALFPPCSPHILAPFCASFSRSHSPSTFFICPQRQCYCIYSLIHFSDCPANLGFSQVCGKILFVYSWPRSPDSHVHKWGLWQVTSNTSLQNAVGLIYQRVCSHLNKKSLRILKDHPFLQNMLIPVQLHTYFTWRKETRSAESLWGSYFTYFISDSGDVYYHSDIIFTDTTARPSDLLSFLMSCSCKSTANL